MLTIDFILVHSDIHSLGTKLVDAITFSHEHDLQLGSFRIVVDILSQFLINSVIFDRNVNRNPLFEFHDVLFECLDLLFSFFQLFE